MHELTEPSTPQEILPIIQKQTNWNNSAKAAGEKY